MTQTSNQLVTFNKPADMAAYLEKCKGQIALALPKHLNPDRMLRLALTCFSSTPKLRECSAQSIVASVIVASQLGLEPGITGQAYLVPYGKTCTLVPGWQGLCGLLNNSGRATAWTGCVFEGDIWDFQLGSAPKCVHIPGPNFGDEDKIQWVYACGKVNGSETPIVEAWPIDRVWKHRDRFNKVGRGHYSFQHPEMYARKVVLLQVLKYLPRSIELQNAIEATNAADNGNTSEVHEGIVVEVETPAQVEPPPTRRGRPPKTETTQQEPAAQTQPTTPYGFVAKDCLDAGISEDALLEYLKTKSATDANTPTLADVPDAVLEDVQREWAGILLELKGPSTEPGDAPTISSDSNSLRAAILERDLDEAQVVTYLVKAHKAGAGCKTLAAVPESGRKWLAENLDEIKDSIAAE